MDTLRKQLLVECDYRISDSTMESFLGRMSEVRLKNGEPLIPYGKLDQNVYVVKEGVVRYAYFDGAKEKTFAFALPASLIIPYYSYYKRLPAFFQVESCSKSVVMKIPKRDFDGLLEESSDFARWILRMSIGQLWFYEMKLAVVNGTAKERFCSLLKNRPEIVERVPLKIIASYIGITPPSLSRLKRQLMPESKRQQGKQ